MESNLLLALLLALAIASMLLYFPLNRGRARYFIESPLDRVIPFIPVFIFPYFAFIPFIIVGLIVGVASVFAPQFLLALIIGVLAGSFVRYFVHSGIRQPEIRRTNPSNKLVHWLYRNDDRAHIFPSTHVLISMIMSYYLALAYPGYAIPIWMIGATIASSTVFVKQHYLVDVIGGLIFAFFAIYATHLILPVLI